METREAVQQLSSGKAHGADAIPAKVYKAGRLSMAEKQSCFTVYGGRKLSHKNLRMHPESTYTSGKDITKSVITTETSPSYTLLERYWQFFC